MCVAEPVLFRGHYLKPVYIARSRISSGGNGLFCAESIKRGELITEYGGEVLTKSFIEKNIPEQYRTHLKATQYLDGPVIDGSVHYSWTHKGKFLFDLPYYLNFNMMGAFANDPRGSHFDANAKFQSFDEAFYHPYRFNDREVEFPVEMLSYSRIFLKATHDIPAGNEILVNYGTHDFEGGGPDGFRGGLPRDRSMRKTYEQAMMLEDFR